MFRGDLFTMAGASALATPHVAKRARDRVLKFIPYADLAVLDPVWTSAYPTRNHGFMVFDTLYGQDAAFGPQPQMAAGAVVENDGKTWNIILCDGLMFHDGTLRIRPRDLARCPQRMGIPPGPSASGCPLNVISDETAKSPAPEPAAVRAATTIASTAIPPPCVTI